MQGMCINSLIAYLEYFYSIFFLFDCFNVFLINMKIHYIYKFFMCTIIDYFSIFFDNMFYCKVKGLEKNFFVYF